MKKENNLIYFLLDRSAINENKLKIKDLLSGKLDWGYVFKKSSQSKVGSLIYSSLVNLGFENLIPNRQAKVLRDNYYKTAVNNLIILERLKEIVKNLENKNVDIIFLKGSYLCEHIYKNIALRPMSDVDILIRKEDLGNVNKTLINLGYQEPPQYKHFLKRKTFGHINTLMYNSSKLDSPSIHIHWHIINSTRPINAIANAIDMKTIWNAKIKIGKTSSNLYRLSLEHLLIYLSIHFFIHQGNRLILLVDIREVLKHYNKKVNWDLLIREAKIFNLLFVIYHVFYFLSFIFKINLDQLKKVKLDKMNFLERYFSLKLKSNYNFSRYSYPYFLSLEKGIINKVSFIIKTIVPNRYIISHVFNIPVSKIKTVHYFQRLHNFVYRLRK